MRSSVLAACVVAASFGLGAAISEAGFGPAQGGSSGGGGGGGPPTGSAGGDLGGTYPNPTVLSLTHVTNTLPAAAFPLLAPNGTAGAPSYSFSAPNAGFFWDGVGVAWGHSGLQDGHLGKNILITSNAALQFGNTVSFNTTADTGVSRGNPSTICIGNGSSGDVSGTLRAATTLLGDGTAGAPSYSFSGETTLGFWRSGTGIMKLQGQLSTTGAINCGANINLGASSFLVLNNGNGSAIGGIVDGNIQLSNSTVTGFGLLQLGGTTNAFPAIKRNAATINFRLADDSADANIAASGIGLGGSTPIANDVVVPSSGLYVFAGQSIIANTADGNIRLTNNAGTTFGLLQFGGTSSSFPALKRSGTTLSARLADDSDFGSLIAGAVGVGATPGASGESPAAYEAQIPTSQYAQRLITVGNGSVSGSVSLFVKNRGTLAVPLIVQNNDQLGGVYFQGATGIFGEASTYAQISGFVDGVPSGDTSAPGRLVFATTTSGSAVPSPRWAILNTGNLIGTSGLALAWSSSSTDPTVAADTRILRGAAGNVLLDNNAGSFGLLQLGGTSASFPAIKRSSASVFMRLADDSGYASLQCHDITTDGAILVSGNISTSTGDLRATGGNLVLGGKATTYSNKSTTGWGVPAIYGADFRQGVTSADGAATTLYTAVNGTSVFRITSDIYATAVTSGTATYTVTWTQNSTTQTMVVSSTVINTLGTATDLINPDNGTNITAKLTGTFSQTVTVTALVEQLN